MVVEVFNRYVLPTHPPTHTLFSSLLLTKQLLFSPTQQNNPPTHPPTHPSTHHSKLDERERRKAFVKEFNLTDYKALQVNHPPTHPPTQSIPSSTSFKPPALAPYLYTIQHLIRTAFSSFTHPNHLPTHPPTPSPQNKEKRKPKDERELIAKLRVFARYQSPQEHEQFVQVGKPHPPTHPPTLPPIYLPSPPTHPPTHPLSFLYNRAFWKRSVCASGLNSSSSIVVWAFAPRYLLLSPSLSLSPPPNQEQLIQTHLSSFFFSYKPPTHPPTHPPTLYRPMPWPTKTINASANKNNKCASRSVPSHPPTHPPTHLLSSQ